MSDQFIGEIRPFPFNFAPSGWAMCQGQLMPIQQNTALFSLLGSQYGGDGVRNFALPDLRGRAPMNAGQGPGLSAFVVGEQAGEATVALSYAQIPAHVHDLVADTGPGTVPGAVGQQLAKAGAPGHGSSHTANVYSAGATAVKMAPNALGAVGGGQPHNNLQPYLTLTWCIALTGVFPQRP